LPTDITALKNWSAEDHSTTASPRPALGNVRDSLAYFLLTGDLQNPALISSHPHTLEIPSGLQQLTKARFSAKEVTVKLIVLIDRAVRGARKNINGPPNYTNRFKKALIRLPA